MNPNENPRLWLAGMAIAGRAVVSVPGDQVAVDAKTGSGMESGIAGACLIAASAVAVADAVLAELQRGPDAPRGGDSAEAAGPDADDLAAIIDSVLESGRPELAAKAVRACAEAYQRVAGGPLRVICTPGTNGAEVADAAGFCTECGHEKRLHGSGGCCVPTGFASSPCLCRQPFGNRPDAPKPDESDPKPHEIGDVCPYCQHPTADQDRGGCKAVHRTGRCGCQAKRIVRYDGVHAPEAAACVDKHYKPAAAPHSISYVTDPRTRGERDAAGFTGFGNAPKPDLMATKTITSRLTVATKQERPTLPKKILCQEQYAKLNAVLRGGRGDAVALCRALFECEPADVNALMAGIELTGRLFQCPHCEHWFDVGDRIDGQCRGCAAVGVIVLSLS